MHVRACVCVCVCVCERERERERESEQLGLLILSKKIAELIRVNNVEQTIIIQKKKHLQFTRKHVSDIPLAKIKRYVCTCVKEGGERRMLSLESLLKLEPTCCIGVLNTTNRCIMLS